MKTGTDNKISSDNKDGSDSKGKTGNTANNSNGETKPVAAASMPANVENTVTRVATTSAAEPPRTSNFFDNTGKNSFFKSGSSLNSSKEQEDEQKRLLEEKRNGLLQDLRNTFEKEADCKVNEVVPFSGRWEAGITSTDVMKLATKSAMRVKCVTLDVDENEATSDLIAFLTFLGEKNKEGDFNPNVSFLLLNGIGFLKGDENIPDIVLEAQSTAVIITFPNAKPSSSDTKKPDAGKTKAGRETKGETKPIVTATTETKTASGAPAGGTTTATKPAATTAIEPPDWIKEMWNDAKNEATKHRAEKEVKKNEKEAKRKQKNEEIRKKKEEEIREDDERKPELKKDETHTETSGDRKEEEKPKEVKMLSPEAIKKQFEGCLKAIETIISNFEPKDIKAIPENIEKEPETKSGEDMRTCFKRLLSGYCKYNGLKNTVKVYRGDLFWENRDKFEEMPRWVVKDLLKHKEKAFEKALLDKINPILKDENKAQVMTKAFASRVWKCIVYYVQEGKFPKIPLLDPKGIFNDIVADSSNFLKNTGEGDCGVISVLQGNALVDGSEADKAPNRKWTADEIKKLRTGAAAGMAAQERNACIGKNGETFNFLKEDAAKWNACTQRINDLESKGSAITDKET